mmetsp:Transcript_51855/g.121588  ORF Transcript_51855/g.121588 Transcript_51855/m.121588 type:complete len:181 (-) Transcript_51855:43-585(-)
MGPDEAVLEVDFRPSIYREVDGDEWHVFGLYGVKTILGSVKGEDEFFDIHDGAFAVKFKIDMGSTMKTYYFTEVPKKDALTLVTQFLALMSSVIGAYAILLRFLETRVDVFVGNFRSRRSSPHPYKPPHNRDDALHTSSVSAWHAPGSNGTCNGTSLSAPQRDEDGELVLYHHEPDISYC